MDPTHPLQVVLSLGNLQRRFPNGVTISDLEEWICSRIPKCDWVWFDFDAGVIEIYLSDWNERYIISIPPDLFDQLAEDFEQHI